MQTNAVHEVQTVVLLLLGLVIIFALVARRLQTPYPIVLVIAGLLLGFMPGMPRITLDPDIVFLLVLPPLLYAAAWNTSWREFRFNLVSISMLAFGLVGFTVLSVALAAPHVFPGFDWRLGFVLGAVVATTDAIAATSIAKRVGLPGRIVDVLEGESLLNDATGLLALEFGLAILVHGQSPSVGSGIIRLAWLTIAGVSSGLLIGFLVDRFERRIEYGAIEIILSLLTPYGTYLAAEAIHASGVLAVVSCGLFLSRGSAEFFSPKVRLQTSAVWESLSFTLNGLTFILIGLQLPVVWTGIQRHNLRNLIISGATFAGLLILLRLCWVFPGAYLAYFIRRRVLRQKVNVPPLRQVFVVGWTGMRGVITLAAAISLPGTLDNGSDLPQRDFIIFLAFCVILVTLVLQGLSLPWLIRLLGLAGSPGRDPEEDKARRAMLDAALFFLHAAREKDRPECAGIYDHLLLHFRTRLDELQGQEAAGQGDGIPAHQVRYREISGELVKIERETAVRLRNQGQINDEVLRRLEQELDLTEARLSLP